VALVHGLGTGTDATTTVLRWVTLACVFAGASAAVWRLGRGWPRHKVVRSAAAVALLLGMALMGYGMDTGFRAAFVRIMSATPAVPTPAGGGTPITPPSPSAGAGAPPGVALAGAPAPSAAHPDSSQQSGAPSDQDRDGAGTDGGSLASVSGTPPTTTTTRPTTTTTRPATTTTTTRPGTTTTTTDD